MAVRAIFYNAIIFVAKFILNPENIHILIYYSLKLFGILKLPVQTKIER